MQYLKFNEVKRLQIDHNSTCNLRCPQCARTVKGETNPDLPEKELTVDDYKTIFADGLLDNIETIIWCGNYGDVVVSKTFLPSLEWIVNQGYTGEFVIITNGSAQNEEWWRRLAHLLGNKGRVHFSIDGLSDTNHLYRVNSNWDKIMRNVRAFIGAGGRARWDFLAFNHNEHQIDEVVKTARELGFEDIRLKKTNRFITDQHYKGKQNTASTQENVKTKKSEYTLHAGAKQGKGLSQHQTIIEKYGSWHNYLNQTAISCKWQPLGQIFVDFEARVWACTWTASGIYHYHESNTQRQQARQILDYYGWDFNCLRHHSFKDILEHDYYKEKLCGSWQGTMEDKPIPKLLCCGRTCGTDYEFSSIEKSNSELIVLKEFNEDTSYRQS